MNQWRKNFSDHPLHNELAKVNQNIDTCKLKTTDPSILESYNRLVIVIKILTAFVNSLNPECTVKVFLDNLYTPLNQLSTQLDAFIKNENKTHLQNANNSADQLVQKIPPFALPETAAQHSEAISTLVTAVEGLIASLTNQSRTTSDSLKKLQEHSESIAKRVEQLDKTIEMQKGRLDTAIAEFQKQFSASEATRRKQIQTTEQSFNNQFVQFKDKITNEIKDLIGAQKTELSHLSQQLTENGKKIIHEMEEKKGTAAKLLNISTNVAVSGSYGKYAGNEKIFAEIFRVVALGFMIALIYGAYKTIEIALTVETIDWRMLALRIATTFTLAIPAFYAVRESNKHRIAEYRYRKMHLELAAVDPYLELLEKTQRNEIKARLSDRFFAQPEQKDDTNNVNAGSLLDILKQVLMTLVKK